MFKKGVSFVFLAAITAVSVSTSACSLLPNDANAAAPSANTATLSRGTLLATVSATGNIRPEREVRLAFLSSGVVAQVNVALGDVVRGGQVLAAIDSADAELSLKKAQLALKDAEAALIIANADYNQLVEGTRTTEIDAAQAALSSAYANYQKITNGPNPADAALARARVLNAEAALRQTQAAYDNAYRANPAGIGASPEALKLEQATNDYNAAKAEYDRVYQAPGTAEKSAAYTQVANAKAQLDRLREPATTFQIERMEAQLMQAKNRIEQAKLDMEQAERKRTRAQLIAPFDGVIAAVDVRAGESVGTEPILTLVKVDQLRVDVNVDEVDVAKIKPGQAVTLRIDSLPNLELKGKIERISPTSNIVNGVVVYVAQVLFQQDGNPLRPGMTVNTRIVLDTRNGVLLAPNWAVRKDKATGKSYLSVLAADNKTQSEIEVQVGAKDESFTEILSGATEGQSVLAPVQ